MPGVEGDIFIGASRMGDAMHGDRVEVRIERRKPGDGGGTRAEGTIVRVLGRAHATVVGVFHYGAGGNGVAPYESRIAQNIVIPPGAELTAELREKLAGHLPRRGVKLPELDGAVVNVEVTRFPTGGMPASGRVVEILGRPGEFGVDVEILIRKHHLPHVFAEDVIDEAHRSGASGRRRGTRGARGFSSLPIVTIDGETARDFDDAVYVEPLRRRALAIASAHRRRSRITWGATRRSIARRGCAGHRSISPIARCRCCRRNCRTASARLTRARIAW